MKPVPIVLELNTDAFGKSGKGEWRWSFEYKNKRGNYEHIAVTSNTDPILVAVTKEQYKSWNNREIVAFRRSLLQFYYARLKGILNECIGFCKKLLPFNFR